MKTCWQKEWKCFSWGVDEANIGTEFRVELQAPHSYCLYWTSFFMISIKGRFFVIDLIFRK